jgi:hypothetical protein
MSLPQDESSVASKRSAPAASLDSAPAADSLEPGRKQARMDEGAGRPTERVGMESVPKSMLCTGCNSLMVKPRMLRCGHNFCSLCVVDHTNFKALKRCLDCKKETCTTSDNAALESVIRDFVLKFTNESTVSLFQEREEKVRVLVDRYRRLRLDALNTLFDAQKDQKVFFATAKDLADQATAKDWSPLVYKPFTQEEIIHAAKLREDTIVCMDPEFALGLDCIEPIVIFTGFPRQPADAIKWAVDNGIEGTLLSLVMPSENLKEWIETYKKPTRV